MIKMMMMSERNAMAPICVCDECGERIVDARQALAMHPGRSDKPGELSDAIFVHKGACDRNACAKHGQGSGTEELAAHLIALAENAGIDATTFIKLSAKPDLIEQA